MLQIIGMGERTFNILIVIQCERGPLCVVGKGLDRAAAPDLGSATAA